MFFNFEGTSKYIEKQIGPLLINKYCVKGLKGFLPCFLVSIAFLFPFFLEEYSYHSRVTMYYNIVDPLYEANELWFREGKRWYTENVGSLNELMKTGMGREVLTTSRMKKITEIINSYSKPRNGIVVELLRRTGL